MGKRYFRIAPNTNNEQRKGEIIIGKAGDPRSLMDVLTVTQGKNRVLELSQKDYDVRAEGGKIILNMVTNLDYTVVLPEWIHQINTRTRASIIRPQLRFAIDAYPGYNQEDRLGLIIFKDKESEFADTVKVTQHGRLQKTYHVATAGTLPELIGDADKNRINALVLTGKLNGKNIEVIGDYCFDDCATLFSITMYEGLKTIGYSAFGSAANLQSCIIPSTVTSIGSSAFNGCSALKSLVFPVGITKIESSTCSNCNRLEMVVIPEGVTVIERDAFIRCSALKEVKLPSTLLELGRDVFEKCTSLTSIDIPYGIKEIQGWANGGGYFYGTFNECTSLQSVTIPSSVERIGDAAFRSTALTSVDIPSSVVSIGTGAFQYSKLTSVTFREGLQVYVPKGCKAAYQADPSWAAFVHIVEE